MLMDTMNSTLTNLQLPDWAMTLNCAITVCDKECNILFMNQLSRDTFAHGSDELIGTNLLHCHNPHSQEIIHRLLTEGGVNCYTIDKKGVKKMIYQSAWRDPEGKIAGLVELSMVLPAEVPHYIRG